jgi:hypothetical protein
MITPLEMFKLRLQTSLRARNVIGMLVIFVVLSTLEGLGRLVFAFDPLTSNHGVPCGPVAVTLVAPFVGAIAAICAVVTSVVLYNVTKLPLIVGDMITNWLNRS